MTKPNNIPGIRETPIFGSMSDWLDNRLLVWKRVAEECGDVGEFHLGPFPVIVFNTPDFARQILVDQADAFDKGTTMRRARQPVVGNGLLNSEGLFHHEQRKLISPAFQPRHISSYADTMVAYTWRAQQEWREGQVIDISKEMKSLTMSIAGKVLFDADVLTEADELGAAVTTVVEYMQYSINHLFPVPLDWPAERNRQVRAALATIRRRVRAMIDERREHPQERDDLLSILLQARADDGSVMSDEQVMDEAMTLFLAGHETISNTLAWGFYLLTTHPEVYARLLDEVDTVLQGRTPSYADLPNLPFALSVFKETLRLYPPADGLPRRALRDVEIGGHLVRKGRLVIVPIYTIQRRPEYFPDPERFDPDRFLPERVGAVRDVGAVRGVRYAHGPLQHRYAFMPFGAGPRICIGSHFAMMEGHLVLAALAQSVRFELVPGQEIVPHPAFVIRQKHGCRVVVRRRGGGGLTNNGPFGTTDNGLATTRRGEACLALAGVSSIAGVSSPTLGDHQQGEACLALAGVSSPTLGDHQQGEACLAPTEDGRRRGKFQGAIQIVQYNWPFYVQALLGCLAALSLLALVPLPWVLSAPLALGIAAALYFSVASLVVSWWVYDLSKLSKWDWIAPFFPVAPRRWANIHAGLDETSLDLRRLFPAPGSQSVVLDIYDPEEMTEPSIIRARLKSPSKVAYLPANVSRLPFADCELDATFLIFAAHEVRKPEMRLALFKELHRVLAPRGKLLLVEHVRDWANFAAFGPGFLHFMPRSEWLRLARESGFMIDREFSITPFVRVWILEKAS